MNNDSEAEAQANNYLLWEKKTRWPKSHYEIGAFNYKRCLKELTSGGRPAGVEL